MHIHTYVKILTDQNEKKSALGTKEIMTGGKKETCLVFRCLLQ